VVRIAVVGAGFGGVGLAVRLKQAGFDDLVVLERGDDVGGVWRENTYPGAACDVASALYSFSFAPKADWSRRFAKQAEILDYIRGVARDFDVLRHVRLGIEVLSAAYDEGTATWTLRLSDGTTHEADVLVTACGQLSTPKLPDVPGLDTFAGKQFHSAQWDHGHRLDGERVAVLGTGASAIQFVPEIAPRVAALTVFQRSAPYVVPKPDREYGLRARHPALRRAGRLGTYLWNESRSLGFNTEPRLLEPLRRRFLAHLAAQVPDQQLRTVLTPTDPMGCKRILISNDWYAALQLPHVEVVAERVTDVRPAGVLTADGRLREVDTLVLGTGFAATELVAPMTVTSCGGRTLAQAWEGGAEAYLGTTVAGFPDLYLLYGPNTNLGHNSIVFMLEAQYRYVLQAVRHRAAGGQPLSVRPEVQRAYNDRLQERARGTVFAGGCTSWYLTADGRNTQNWPGSTLDFARRTRRLRLTDYEPAR
jgi:cation diffusion facilitator CzcD-associated flavoprotein CzcO